MAKVANPQGKGNHLLSNHWFPLLRIPTKSNDKILSDYVLSVLVLSAEFSFKPVTDTAYTLYLWKGVLRLSLIPRHKCQIENVEYLADCHLDNDLTWRVNLKDWTLFSNLAKHWFSCFAEKIENKLVTSHRFQDALPFYEESLPFYRRLYASGLAKSLSLSAQQTGLLQCKPALKQLPFVYQFQ